MARKLFEEQGIRTRRGRLAPVGTVFVVYSDAAGTVPADISATSGGSAIPGSAVAAADIAGLGPSAFRFYGPPGGDDTLYLRCLSDASLGVQEIEADTDERLDALEAGGGGGGGAHPDLATHDTLGLATDAELAAHEADTTVVHGIADTSALATSSSVSSAVSGHEAAANPHPAYALDTDLSAHDADTSVHGIADTTVLATDAEVASAVSGHAAAADPHGDRAYADTVAQGLDPKASVRVKSTGNLTLSGEQTIDGVLTSASRVLVANQTTAEENGIYVSAAGAWSRATDADISGEVTTGLYCFVEEGTAQASSGWVLITPAPITLGTTPLTFSQFSQAGQVFGGAGLLKTGNTLDVIAGTGITVAGDTVGITPGGITDTQVNASAAIAESKLALNFPTHAENHAARHAAAGADPLTGYATSVDLNTHEGAADPHQGYVLESAHTLAAHDTLGVVTDAILATHEADTTVIHGIANTARLVLDTDVFGPPSLPGLHAWYAADRITGLADAAAVATWVDASGRGQAATTATSSNPPTYRTGIVNGLPAVQFDGIDDALQTAAFPALSQTTVIAALKLTSTGGSTHIVDGIGNRHMLGIRGGNYVVQQGGASFSAGPAADTTSFHVITGVFAGDATSHVVKDGTASASSNVGTTTLTRLAIGRQGNAVANYLPAYLAELVIYSRVLSDLEREQVEWYLGQKYGLTVSSPDFTPAQQVGPAMRDTAKLSVTDAGLWVSTKGSDNNDGLSPGSAKATVQAALTAMTNTGGTLHVLGGTHVQTDELVVPAITKGLRIVGQATAFDDGATALSWPTDLGAGKFALRSASPGAYNLLSVEHLRMRGPGGNVAFGTFPANMDGLGLGRRVTGRDLHIQGFRSGVVVTHDHNRLERCNVTGNGYGLYWTTGTAGTPKGDHLIYDCDLSGHYYASVALKNDAAMEGATFFRGHLGASPYAVYCEPGRSPSSGALFSVRFIYTSIEAVGDGVINSPDQTAKCDYVHFLGGHGGMENEKQIVGAPRDAVFKLGDVNYLMLRDVPYLAETAGMTSYIDCTRLANFVWEDSGMISTMATLNAAGMSLVRVSGECLGNRWIDGDSYGFIATPSSSEAVVKGQVVAAHGTDSRQVRPYASAGRGARIRGVALNAAPADTASLTAAVVVVEQGRTIPVLASAAVGAQAQVMVDPADLNKVKTYDGSLEPFIGRGSAGGAAIGSAGLYTTDVFPDRLQQHTKPAITGSRGGNAALADLLTDLAALGIITDSSTA